MSPRTPGLMLSLALAAMTAACSTVAPEPATPVVVTAGASSPQPIAGYDWHLTTHDGIARLAYGIAESDELKLAFECGAGSGTLQVLATAPSGTRLILLESGGDTERLTARSEPSELGEGDLLTAESPADAPVFQRFRRLGWLAQWIGDRREAYAPQPGSAADVDRFFALCD
ncbi:hypothetical protein BZG35_05795 [Brevundimonas sp. LM2]|uniref:hypothetical protein n=1 Tax=Brevundimonas sp. LM2 TaxID=1938605 RepID=UPI000983EE41|nr:hypothetical protein [Brevundimonas sp. LM2]AQR61214.1 hypothetical protein BZG35_05795 [Brevundimonas sp. LM2]